MNQSQNQELQTTVCTNVTTIIQFDLLKIWRQLPPWMPGAVFAFLGLTFCVVERFAEICFPFCPALGWSLMGLAVVILAVWFASVLTLGYYTIYQLCIKAMNRWIPSTRPES